VDVDLPLPGAQTSSSLVQQARVLGGYVWVEKRLFEILGAWVTDETTPELRLVFDAGSLEHAWHSELFAERLPALEFLGADGTPGAPSPEVGGFFDALGEAQTPATRLAGLGRVVLPRLVTGYWSHLGRSALVADAAVVRALRLVLRDEIEAWRATEAHLETHIRTPDELRVALEHAAALEARVATSGPGLVPWPSEGKDKREKGPDSARSEGGGT
jgi:hypothetical protein